MQLIGVYPMRLKIITYTNNSEGYTFSAQEHPLKVSAAGCLLVYLPSDQSAHELIQTSCQIAINRKALALAVAL
jgi:hypothetical protein